MHYFTHDTKYLLNRQLLSFFIQGFFDLVMANLEDNQYVTLILKVKFDVDGYKTISRSITFNKTEFTRVQNYFWAGLELANENYLVDSISKVVFSYFLGNSLIVKASKFNKDRKQIKVPTTTFGGVNLPNTMEFTKWGSIILRKPNFLAIAKENSTIVYNITIGTLFNLVKVTSCGEILLEFKDIKGKDLISFTREISNKSKYVFINGKLIFKEALRKTTYMTKIKVDKNP